MMSRAWLLLLTASASLAAEAPAELERVTVTASRDAQPADESVYAITAIGAEELSLAGASHPNEILARVPGTWISRGNGQEHLTAIRSPVLSGAGACGAFMFLEDGIPVRPAGFCNVNQLFEINTEQADSIEVLRGPGSVLHGSNALHGVINVIHSPPSDGLGNRIGLALGEFGFGRLAADSAYGDGGNGWRSRYFGETSDSNQRDAGHQQHKLNLDMYRDGWRAHLAATSLDQDTAGYIVGEDAFRDPAIRRSNPNPEAFRKADALRLWAVREIPLEGNAVFEVRPFARYSEMQFLQHFLPGTPLEENGHRSAGIIASYKRHADRAEWSLGMDMEWASGWLRETQAEPITTGSEFLRETRPAGRHYDYEVAQYTASPWINLEYGLTQDTTLIAGLRADYLMYDYNNRMRDGNTREDGSDCGLGGCIYNRPTDRTDSFTFVSPKIALRHRLDEQHVVYGNLARGFRVPQATELYRLQRGQNVADLDPERIDSIETGLHGKAGSVTYDLAAFAMLKRNVIFRDAEGFNVSDGRTRHRGIEFDAGWQANEQWQLALRGTYARHTYAFDYLPGNGEHFMSGRDVDTAPKTLGSLLARWTPRTDSMFELEYQHIGSYYLDAENTQRYPGHGLWHARWGQQFGDFDLRVRLNNILDTDYAERADFAFGEHRYFPGWPRRVSMEVAYNF